MTSLKQNATLFVMTSMLLSANLQFHVDFATTTISKQLAFSVNN